MIKNLQQIGFTSLLESLESGDKWKVMIIEEGLSKNGKFYPREALQKAIPLFEKSKVSFYEFGSKFNHLPIKIEEIRPEGFPLQTAGFLENVKFETINVDGRERSGLTGILNLLNTEKVKDLKETLVSTWKKGLKNFLGLSINAEGEQVVRMLNGIPVAFVKAIKNVFSTDFVTQPAAGGGLINLIESINNHQGGEEQMFKKLLEMLKQLNPKILEGVSFDNIKQEEVVGILEKFVGQYKEEKHLEEVKSLPGLVKESKFEEAEGKLKKILESSNSSLSEAEKAKALKEAQEKEAKEKALKEAQEKADKALKEAEAKNKEANARLDAIEQRQKIADCREELVSRLSESKLPTPVREKIKRQYTGKIFETKDLEETIKSERETLAKLVESEADFNFGDVNGSFIEREPSTRLQASLDLMMDGKIEDAEKKDYEGIEPFNSLKEAYIAYTDDPHVTGNLGPKALKRLQEADATTFNYALGFSMQRRMLRDYKTIDPLWTKIANVVPVNDFKLQERIRWGGFGQIPTVQAARTVAGTPIDTTTPTYPELGFPQDQEATYAVATKGGIVTLTRRMIIDDDLNILRKVPNKIGRAAANTLNRFVFDLLLNVSAGTINGGTIYDSIALYATAHKNYRTGAFSFDNLQALLDDMYHQVEFGNQTLITDNPLTSGATTVNVTAGTGQYFKAGDMVWAEGEIMTVSSVSTDALTVIRGQFGTTAASHVVSTILYKVTEILGLSNPYLWVPRSLRGKALALKNSEKNPESAENAVNTIRDLFEPIVSPFLRGDENNYYLSARPEDLEGIEVGFLAGRQEPELLLQDNPTVGNVFTYDQIRYKVRHEYGGTVVDFRAFAGAIVS